MLCVGRITHDNPIAKNTLQLSDPLSGWNDRNTQNEIPAEKEK